MLGRKANAVSPVAENAIRRYIGVMTKAGPKPSNGGSYQVKNAKTGQFVTVRGVGALKGHLTLKKGVDLTKPIASQALRGGKTAALHKA